MKKVIWKAYYDFEKEEKWLNEMSAKGFALVSYTWMRYEFEECEPGEYIYRLELLEHHNTHPESEKYIRFMEENGVQHVTSYIRWVYFRKKAADGDFSIYSDTQSRIRHYQRINKLFTVIAILEFLLAGLNIGRFFWGHSFYNGFEYYMFSILIILGFVLLAAGHPARQSIKRLRKEQQVVE